MYEKIVFKVGSRWEFKITLNGSIVVAQDFDPEKSGFVPMDEATANLRADEVISRLQSPQS